MTIGKDQIVSLGCGQMITDGTVSVTRGNIGTHQNRDKLFAAKMYGKDSVIQTHDFSRAETLEDPYETFLEELDGAAKALGYSEEKMTREKILGLAPGEAARCGDMEVVHLELWNCSGASSGSFLFMVRFKEQWITHQENREAIADMSCDPWTAVREAIDDRAREFGWHRMDGSEV